MFITSLAKADPCFNRFKYLYLGTWTFTLIMWYKGFIFFIFCTAWLFVQSVGDYHSAFTSVLMVDFRWSVLDTKQHVVTEACACIILDFPKASQGIIRVSHLLVLQDEKRQEYTKAGCLKKKIKKERNTNTKPRLSFSLQNPT